MRLASSSFMYQGETMRSGISWDLYVPATGKIPVALCLHLADSLVGKERSPRSKQLRLPRKPAMDIKSARATYDARPRLNLSTKYWTFPAAHGGKRAGPYVARSFIDLVAALLSRPRVTSIVRSYAIVGRVRDSPSQTSPTTRTRLECLPRDQKSFIRLSFRMKLSVKTCVHHWLYNLGKDSERISFLYNSMWKIQNK